MIRENQLKRKLKNGESVLGTFVKIHDPSVVELLGLLGFDFFVIDNEHVAMNKESMVGLIRAADITGITPIVRVRENRPVEILQALDEGALGVMVPQVNNMEDALSVVQSVKYSPVGNRGLAGSHRAAGYGTMNPLHYVQQANEHTFIGCYCETKESIINLEDILSIETIDLIFIGPFDLSQSLGVIAEPNHPKVLEQIDFIIHKVHNAGKAVGIIASDVEEAKRWIEKGVQFITIKSDQGMIASLGSQIVSDWRIR
jgi:4-hydroxy-2-oxoheptanedioate aldolase